MNIAKKIGYGYAFAIGIAVLGTALGVGAGGYYRGQSEQQHNLAQEQQELLQELENSILNIQFHPNRLFNALDDAIAIEYETSEFLYHLTFAREILASLSEFAREYPHHLAVPTTEWLTFQQRYEITLDSYEAKIHAIWEGIDPFNLQSDDADAVREQIIAILTGSESQEMRQKFESLEEELLRIEQAAKQQKEAAIAGEILARRMSAGIVLGTMVCAVAIAIFLAFRTSRAIAGPLEAVTKVARDVTKDSNFDLRAPVITKDEVGLLDDSLNQLIAWTGEYTHKLERSQETLEQRVEDRTRELQATLSNLKKTQTQLIQTEKMSGLGQMVAGVAHEINNPVSFIHGNLIHLEASVKDLLALIDLYREQYPQHNPEVEDLTEEIDLEFVRADLPEMLKSMKMGSNRIKTIVLSLRNFSRLDEAEMKDVDLHVGIDNTLIILSNRLKKGVDVVRHYDDLPPVFCYPAQLNQVFMNLMVNALDAMFDGEIEDKQLIIMTEKIGSDRVGIKIRDNGPGIPDSVKEKLFDPFFTTKPIGKGTGLGLTICYQIVEK
ncbi:MAG: sensor histidine kinase, partial [Spirulina sp.]